MLNEFKFFVTGCNADNYYGNEYCGFIEAAEFLDYISDSSL
jgi:hypothetical protein